MRALTVGWMVLGLMEIALVGITSPASPVKKVVIGVLDFEVGGGFSSGRSYLEPKKAVMRDLKQNPRVKVVDIHDSCSLSDLKKHGYEQAERFLRDLLDSHAVIEHCRQKAAAEP